MLGAVLLAQVVRMGLSDARAWAPTATRCSRVLLEGEVRAGTGYRKSFGGGLDFALEPIASGWVMRVLPTGESGTSADYAGVATPPYRSVSPLLVSTDFSFRAQDAVGWNPRRFRYAADKRAFVSLEALYRKIVSANRSSPADEAAVGGLVSEQPEGALEVVDATLAPGTADQTRAAALLSTRYGATAHRTEQPEGGKSTALGRIGSLRFRAKLDLKRGIKPAPGVQLESYVCGAN